MIGMYWCAEPVELLTEIIKIRDCRPVEVLAVADAVLVVPPGSKDAEVAVEASSFEPPCLSAHEIVWRLMWLNASVRAPAIMVEVVELISAAFVESSSSRRLRVTCSSTMRKGRYLLAWVAARAAEPSSERPLISISPSASVERLVSCCWPWDG